MRPHPTLSKSLGSVCLAPVRSSTNLPSISFQSLTNCLRFATHSEILSFQPITNCPICKSFALITIQHAGGVGEPVCLLTLCMLRSFQCVFQLSPLFSRFCALFCATTAMQLFSNQFVAHSFRRHGGVGGPVITSKVPYIFPSSVCSKSFVCHSYENCRGVYAFFPIWNGSNQLPSSSFTPSFEGASTIDSCPDTFLFHESPVTNHKSHFSDFPAAPNSSLFQSLLTNKNRLCYTEPVIGKLAS